MSISRYRHCCCIKQLDNRIEDLESQLTECENSSIDIVLPPPTTSLYMQNLKVILVPGAVYVYDPVTDLPIPPTENIHIVGGSGWTPTVQPIVAHFPSFPTIDGLRNLYQLPSGSIAAALSGGHYYLSND